MDLKLIGNFIQTCRKNKKLTQIQLAQKIGVSEKTISKWECGYGFPDATLMLPLCKVLDITANELLTGRLLESEKEYKEKAENNLINLKSEQEKSIKQLFAIEIVLGYVTSVLFILGIVCASYLPLSIVWRVILIVACTITFFVGMHFCLLIEKDVGFYKCKHCHHKYIPTLKQMYGAMHIGRTRYLKCPHCNKRSWTKKRVSDN